MRSIQMTTNFRDRNERSYSTAASLKINPVLLKSFWDTLECSGPDLFRVVKYDGKSVEQVQKGMLSRARVEKSPAVVRGLISKSRDFDDFMNDSIKEAYKNMMPFSPCNEVIDEQRGYYALFTRCSDGIVGVAFANDGDVKKARTAVSYTIGLISLKNRGYDRILFNTSWNLFARA